MASLLYESLCKCSLKKQIPAVKKPSRQHIIYFSFVTLWSNSIILYIMKTRAIFLSLLLAIVLTDTSNAQVGVLRRAMNRTIDRKIDSAIIKSEQDKAKERAEADKNQADSTKPKDTSTKATGRGVFGAKIDNKFNDEYTFTGRIYTQMETYDKKEVNKADFYTYFNSTTMNAGIEVKPVNYKEGDKTQPMVILFDSDNRTMMMLLVKEGPKTGFISGIPSDSAMAAQAKNQKGAVAESPTITKTGNSRVIAGYKCDEYKVTEANKEGYANVWMTKDVKLKADKKYWSQSGLPTYYNNPEFAGGMLLAMDEFDKNNKLVMKMETKEINEKFNHSISTVGYTFMKWNLNQSGKK